MKTYPIDGFLVQVSHHIPKDVSLRRVYEYRPLSHKPELYNMLDVMHYPENVHFLAFGVISIDVTLSSLSFVRLSLCPASLILRIELQD